MEDQHQTNRPANTQPAKAIKDGVNNINTPEWRRAAQPLRGPMSVSYRGTPRKHPSIHDRNSRKSTPRHRQADPTLSTPGVTFSTELWIMVLERLPKPALRRISRASHYFHALSIPILFHTIDFSVKPLICSTHLQLRMSSKLAHDVQNTIVQQ